MHNACSLGGASSTDRANLKTSITASLVRLVHDTLGGRGRRRVSGNRGGPITRRRGRRGQRRERSALPSLFSSCFPYWSTERGLPEGRVPRLSGEGLSHTETRNLSYERKRSLAEGSPASQSPFTGGGGEPYRHPSPPRPTGLLPSPSFDLDDLSVDGRLARALLRPGSHAAGAPLTRRESKFERGQSQGRSRSTLVSLGSLPLFNTFSGRPLPSLLRV